MESIQTTPPNCRILNNSPALHSLKRQQLVQLCKRNGIKASGKNTELIGRLKAHASDMSDNCMSPGDGDEDKENKRIPLPRPSETWSVIDEDSREITTMREGLKDIQEEVEQEMLTQSTLRGFGGSSFNEYHPDSINSKSSTLTSSFKLFTNSLKKVSNKMSTGPGQALLASIPVDEPAVTLEPPELETPVKTQPSPLPSPATGNEDDPHDVSIRDLGHSTIRLVSTNDIVPSPPALRPFTPTFDACYSPESQVSPLRHPAAFEDPLPPGAFPGMVPTSPKSVLQATPASPFIFGSPAHQTSKTEFHSAAASVLAEMNARLGLIGTSNEVGMDLLEKKDDQAFTSTSLFSQMDKPKTDITLKFDKVHEHHFQQMEGIGDWYARKYGKASPDKVSTAREDIPNKKRKSDVLAGPNKRIVRPSAANGRRSSRVQASRVVSQTIDEPNEERQTKRPKISFIDNPEAAPNHKNEQDPKPDSMEIDEKLQTQEEKEKERAAIKKRLEVSRARRRSSMGRVSVGANKPALIPNQPKKGLTTKFGFLSSAKNLVKNVWNRGIGTGPQKEQFKQKPAVPVPVPSSATQKKEGPRPNSNLSVKSQPAAKTSNSIASTKSIGLLPARKPSIRTSTVSTNNTSQSRTSTVSSTNTGSRRAAIPSFSRLARTSSLVKGPNTSVNGTGRSQGSTANSIGFRNPGSLLGGSTRTSETSLSNVNSAARKRSSTLLAPTASSLARMQHTVKPPSLSMKTTNAVPSIHKITAADPAPTPSRIPTFSFTSPGLRQPGSNKEGDNVVEKARGTIFTGGPPSFTPSKSATLNEGQTGAAKPRPLPGRRPRISRSRVIARVGAQRAASHSKEVNSTNGRKSLNTPKTRGSLGVRVSGIGSKAQTRESFASHRKRLRQSEIVRRRSKASSIGAATTSHDAGKAEEENTSDAMEE